MQSFPIYTIESAPEQSKPALQSLKTAFGMVPNIAGAMATSPVLINSLVGLFQTVHGGSFTEAQIQTLLLTNAVTNACSWAVAFHTALALKEGLDPTDVSAIREGRAPKDRQYAALSTLDVATLTVGCLRLRWLDRRSMRKGQQRGCPSARVDGLEPFQMSSPRAGPAGHLSGSDRATRCPTGKVPPAVHQLGAVGRAAVNATERATT